MRLTLSGPAFDGVDDRDLNLGITGQRRGDVR